MKLVSTECLQAGVLKAGPAEQGSLMLSLKQRSKANKRLELGRLAERIPRRKPVGGAPYRSGAIGLRAVPPTNQREPRPLSPTGEDPPEAHAWQRPAGVGPIARLMSPALESGDSSLIQEKAWQAASLGSS